MNVFFVYCHPEPKSFNRALLLAGQAALLGAGHTVQVSDLYQMQFDPVSDRRNFTTVKDPDYYKQQVEENHASQVDGFVPEIAHELKKLEWCDLLVFQFPLWWFGLPAMLKGWVDRVMVAGHVYGGGKWYDRGAFVGKRAVCSLTTGGPPSIYEPTGLNGDIRQILFPINHGIFNFTGFAPLAPQVSYAPAHIDKRQREAALVAWAERLLTIETETPLSYPGLDAYDEQFRLKTP
jgi:NAD(P)H dehydrogenase (quinone)